MTPSLHHEGLKRTIWFLQNSPIFYQAGEKTISRSFSAISGRGFLCTTSRDVINFTRLFSVKSFFSRRIRPRLVAIELASTV
jgi:hypothetical protein